MKAAKGKRPWWRRWTWRLLLIAVALRVLLGVFLEPLVRYAASFADLEVTLRNASLSLLGASLRLDDVIARPTGAPASSTPLLLAQEITVDLAMSRLLRGQVHIVDASIAGAALQVERRVDGTLSLPASWTTPAPVTVEPPPPEPGPTRFQLPFAVDSLRLHDVRLRFDDALAPSALPLAATLDLDIANLGVPDREASIELRVYSPQWLDDAWLSATATMQPAQLRWRARGAIAGLRPQRLPLARELAESLADLRAIAAEWQSDGSAEVPENAVAPALAAKLQLKVFGDERERLTLDARAGPTVLPRGGAGVATLPLHFELRAPELVDTLAVHDGELRFGDGGLGVHGELKGSGITLARFTPLMTKAGLQLPSGGMQIGCRFDAEFGDAISASLDALTVRGGEHEITLRHATLDDLRSGADGLSIGRAELEGPEAAVTLAEDGSLLLAGLRVLPGAPPATPLPAAPWRPPQLPRLRIGSVQWHGAKVSFIDAMRTPPATIALTDVTLRADALTLGHDAPPGRVELAARVPGAIEALQLRATIGTAAGHVDAEVHVDAAGITGSGIAPWLPPSVVPTLQQGALRCIAGASFTSDAEGMLLRTKLADLTLTAGDAPLLQLRVLHGEGLRQNANAIDLGSFTVEQPFIAVTKHRDGTWQVAGVHFVPVGSGPTPTDTGAATAATSAQAAANANSAVVAPAATANGAPTPPSANASLRVGEVKLQQATISLQRPDCERPDTMRLDVEAGPWLGPTEAVPFRGELSLTDAIERLQLHGNVVAEPLHAEVDVHATGMRGAGLDTLLQPALRSTLQQGELRLRASLDHHGTSGLRAAGAVELTDGGTTLAAIDEFVAELVEASPQRVHVGTVALRGVRGQIDLHDDGAHVAGLLLGAPPDTAALPNAPSPGPSPTSAPTRQPRNPADRGFRLPLLTIEDFRCELQQVAVRRMPGEAVQLSGTVTMAPWTARLGSRGEAAKLALQLAAPPLCRELRVDLEIDPFTLTPSVDAKLRATGVDTTALTTVLPALQSTLQGLADDVEVTATVAGRIDLKRRDQQWFDLQRPFGGDLAVENVGVRQAGVELPLLTIGAIDVIARAIDPRRGHVLLRAIDIDDVTVSARRTAEGIELANCLLLREPPPPAPTEPGALTPAATTPPPDTPVIGGAAPVEDPEAPEFAVDRLGVQGLAARWVDLTTTPPTDVPLSDVEFELERFSTRSNTEPRPFTFRLVVRGGELAFDRRVARSSLLSRVVDTASSLVGQGGQGSATEQRPLVDELRMRGELQLFPQPKGRIVTDVDGFELPALRGLANLGDVQIHDGLVDHSSTIVLRGADGVDIDSNTVFTWLSLREPADGPISRYLRLPGTLETTLFLLRNDADEQRIPVKLHVPGRGLTRGQLTQAIVDAFVSVTASAVTGAAKRAGGMVIDAIGLGGGAAKVPTFTAEWQFEPGDPLPKAADAWSLIDAVRNDPTLEIVLEHELGNGDLERARALATPDRDAVQASVVSLRARRAELHEKRGPLAARVEALYGAGDMQEARQQQARLHSLDSELGQVERTLDLALAMFVSDTERQQKRRAQAAAEAIGQNRLLAVITALQRSAPDLPMDQIHARTPRGVPAADAEGGGRVRAALRRRTVR